MITRIIAIRNLEKYIGQDLAQLADQYGITTCIDGKQNKGWKGLTLEVLAGLSNDNKQAPNGLGFELKSTAFYQVKGLWTPKETLIQEIQSDYEFIRTKCTIHGFSALTGKDGRWIQARTKGPGHGSISRAFYARKSLITEIIKL